VPPPGGIREQEGLQLTSVDELNETVDSCRKAFLRQGLAEAWERVCAVVVQPGVEFGDQAILHYERRRAGGLCAAARKLPGIVLEGHSTDYQSRESLRELVEDGVAVLKVGPALTFALRQGLFALEQVESELCHGLAEPERSRLAEELEAAMVANPRHWRGYYQGSEGQLRLARRFSLSDRCRYYWAEPRVDAAVRRLLNNLGSRPIPLTLVSQYFPHLLPRVRQGGLEPRAAALIEAGVVCVLEDYRFASQGAALP
jgi:D-tagatose-1,6-bisphosphate aldolase subunit GatZ/KbaZ